MKASVPRGRYILAVSGGVDSMALLHLFAQKAKSQKPKAKSSGSKLSAGDFQLVVAHFNHGIRRDSSADKELVSKTAEKYGLPFKVGYGRLSKGASEEHARSARYSFLENVKKEYSADAIITAHHQDDLIETAFINIIRGTGRQGLSSMQSNHILRPFLSTTKKEILRYAKKHNLKWHEDSTNKDIAFLRNYIRLKVMPKLTLGKRAELITNLNKVAKINNIINAKIATLSHNTELNRQKFISLPTTVGNEMLAFWFRQNGLRDFDRKTISRVSTAIKTASPGTTHEIIKGWTLSLSKDKAILR